MIEKQILTIQETVKRAKEKGMPVSEYTLRRALRCGAIPCRRIGKKYLICWSNVERWVTCADGQDNMPIVPVQNGIRRIEV